MMLLHEYITKFLHDIGQTHIFGVGGANIEELFFGIQSLNKSKIIVAKNEYSAATMAIGYFLKKKKPGVVLTSSGACILNTIPILAEAYASNIPMIVIAGQIPSSLEGIGAFQDDSGNNGSIDLQQMLGPCCAKVIKIKDQNKIDGILKDLIKTAHEARKPVVLLIPKDLFSKEVACEHSKYEQVHHHETIEDESKNKIKTFITKHKSQKGLLVLGEDLVADSNTLYCNELARHLKCKVVVTPVAKGVYDHYDDTFLGVIGMMSTEGVNKYISECDYIINLGSQFDLISRFGVEEELMNKEMLSISNQKNFLQLIKKQNTEKIVTIHGTPQDHIENFLKDLSIPTKVTSNKEELVLEDKSFSMTNIMSSFNNYLYAEADIFVDAGNCGAFLVNQLKCYGSGVFYLALGTGGMGNSIGAGIGSCLVSSNKTFVFMGDGSFFMHGLEIHTAIEELLPMVFVIFNNNSHGMCETREELFLDGNTGIHRFKKSFLAEGIGKMFNNPNCREISSLDELSIALDDLSSINSPCVLSLNITLDEVPPFQSLKKNELIKKD